MNAKTLMDEAKNLVMGKPDPIRDVLENGRQIQAEPGKLGNRVMLQSKFGCTPEIRGTIGDKLLPPEVRSKVKATIGKFGRELAQFNTDARRSPQKEYDVALAEAAKRRVSGEEGPVKGLCDIRSEIEAVNSAHRLALNQLYREADALLRPFYPELPERALAMFDEQLELERARHKKFGLPFDEPSALLLSLWEGVKGARTLAKSTPPDIYSGRPMPEYWGGGFFNL